MGTCLSLTAEVVAEQNVQHQGGPRLSQVDPNSVSDCLFKDQTIEVRVLDVHDGDSIKVLALHGDQPVKLNIRILGVDAPEIANSKKRLPEERIAAQKARDFVAQSVGQKTKVHILDDDKYGGRHLGRVILADGSDLSELMISKHYARPYNGEKKHDWTLEELTSGPYA